jgi:hypothetical protein
MGSAENPIRGERIVHALGRDYVFRLGNGELVRLQTLWGFDVEDPARTAAFFKLLGVVTADETYLPMQYRQVFVEGLRRYTPDVDELLADDIIDSLGWEQAGRAIAEVLAAVLRVEEDASPKAQAPTAPSPSPGADS